MAPKKPVKVNREECITPEGFFLPKKGKIVYVRIAHYVYDALKESGHLAKWSTESFIKDFNKMVETALNINWNDVYAADKYSFGHVRNWTGMSDRIDEAEKECISQVKTIVVNVYDDIHAYCEAKVQEKYTLQNLRRIEKERQHYVERLNRARAAIPEEHWLLN